MVASSKVLVEAGQRDKLAATISKQEHEQLSDYQL